MNVESIIQNCGTCIVIGQTGYLNATIAGHIGHFAGNPAHASIHTDFNRVVKILDVTADKFTPVKNTE